MKKRYGFSLIELLAVVVIVGILSAFAVPKYRRAMWKSRFAAMMTPAKALARGQEAYYVSTRKHSTSLDNLDVQISRDDRMTYEALNGPGMHGVRATRSDLFDGEGAALVIYNNYSGGAGVLCEAKPDNRDAIWLCKDGLGGKFVGWASPDMDHANYMFRLSGNGLAQGFDFNGDNKLTISDVSESINWIFDHPNGPLTEEFVACFISVLLSRDSEGNYDMSACDDTVFQFPG
jgi:prepilin-type N-terminal cleavage/methylation domain-containing protein